MKNIRHPLPCKFALAIAGVAIALWGMAPCAAQTPSVEVDLGRFKIVEGVAEFDRSSFITLHHYLYNINEQELDVLLGDLGADLGRVVGRLDWEMRFVGEDPARPGMPDLEQMRARGEEAIASDAASSVAGKYGDADIVFTSHPKPLFPNLPWQAAHNGSDRFVPTSWEGAISFYTRFLDWNYGAPGVPRPRYLEVMNEPLVHAGAMETTYEELIQFHGAVADSFHRAFPESLVGGYASAWPEFERWDFGIWRQTMGAFIDEVGDRMDFLSVHLYDYYPTSGPPVLRVGSNVEAILDLIRHYSHQSLGQPLPLIISEYGSTGDRLAEPYSPERDFLSLRAINGILMQLIDRPEQMLKTIPFITGRTDDVENPYPFAARRKLSDGSYEWTHLLKFYELWEDVDGRFLDVRSTDPDISVHAFREGDLGWVVINNMLVDDQEIGVFLRNGDSAALQEERRLYLSDGVPVLERSVPGSIPAGVVLEGYETRVWKVDLSAAEPVSGEVRWSRHFADDHLVPIPSTGSVELDFSRLGEDVGASSGRLDIGIARAHGLSVLPTRIELNGRELAVPTDWAGDDQATRDQFWGVVPFEVPAGYLDQDTRVEMWFDEPGGWISSAVLTIATTGEQSSTVEQPNDLTAAKLVFFPNPASGSMRVEGLDSGSHAIEVYDLLGRRVTSWEGVVEGESIDIRDLSTGVYFARVKAGRHQAPLVVIH